jgi:hypothetical protein
MLPGSTNNIHSIHRITPLLVFRAEKFKLSQEAFNKPYKLRAQANAKTKKRRKTSVGRNLAKAS